jgi:hypothetical protein
VTIVLNDSTINLVAFIFGGLMIAFSILIIGRYLAHIIRGLF